MKRKSIFIFGLAVIFIFIPIFAQSQSQVIDLKIPLRDERKLPDNEKQSTWHVNVDVSGLFYRKDTKGNDIKDIWHDPEKSLSLDFGTHDANNSTKRLDAKQIGIVAACDGNVTIIHHQDGRGDEVKIESPAGFSTTYMHTVADTFLKNGQDIVAGDRIGRLADWDDLNLPIDPKTGAKKADIYWTGPHLHFSVNYSKNADINFSLEDTNINNIISGQYISGKTQIAPPIVELSSQANLNAKLNPKGFLAKLKDLSSLDVWNATFGIPIAQAPTTSYGASDFLDNATTVSQTQNQTTKNVEDTGTLSTGGGDRPTTHYGYYIGMVTKDDAGSRSYADDVVTDSRQNFDSSNIMVGDNADTYHILDGSQDYNDPTITAVKISGKTVISGLPVTVEHGEYGYNTYMEWGYWLLNDLISDGQYNYYVDNKGWYVLGDVTTNTQMDYLAAKNISGTYTGNGYGTYWIGPGGYWNKVIMNGTFSSDVSFSSRTISNFDLSVSGDGHTASISNASGSFSGSSSHFALDGNSGQWKIDGISADADGKGGYGSVYGPNGEAIGGVWGMHNDASNKHAVGAFKGNK